MYRAFQVYTMWENLHKTNGMDVGQIGFHKQKAVKKIRLASRENVIVNRLNKTKVQWWGKNINQKGTGKSVQELYPWDNSELLQVEKQLDFRAEREGRDKKERDEKKRAFKNLVRYEFMTSPLLMKHIRDKFQKG